MQVPLDKFFLYITADSSINKEYSIGLLRPIIDTQVQRPNKISLLNTTLFKCWMRSLQIELDSTSIFGSCPPHWILLTNIYDYLVVGLDLENEFSYQFAQLPEELMKKALEALIGVLELYQTENTSKIIGLIFQVWVMNGGKWDSETFKHLIPIMHIISTQDQSMCTIASNAIENLCSSYIQEYSLPNLVNSTSFVSDSRLKRTLYILHMICDCAKSSSIYIPEREDDQQLMLTRFKICESVLSSLQKTMENHNEFHPIFPDENISELVRECLQRINAMTSCLSLRISATKAFNQYCQGLNTETIGVGSMKHQKLQSFRQFVKKQSIESDKLSNESNDCHIVQEGQEKQFEFTIDRQNHSNSFNTCDMFTAKLKEVSNILMIQLSKKKNDNESMKSNKMPVKNDHDELSRLLIGLNLKREHTKDEPLNSISELDLQNLISSFSELVLLKPLSVNQHKVLCLACSLFSHPKVISFLLKTNYLTKWISLYSELSCKINNDDEFDFSSAFDWLFKFTKSLINSLRRLTKCGDLNKIESVMRFVIANNIDLHDSMQTLFDQNRFQQDKNSEDVKKFKKQVHPMAILIPSLNRMTTTNNRDRSTFESFLLACMLSPQSVTSRLTQQAMSHRDQVAFYVPYLSDISPLLVQVPSNLQNIFKVGIKYQAQKHLLVFPPLVQAIARIFFALCAFSTDNSISITKTSFMKFITLILNTDGHFDYNIYNILVLGTMLIVGCVLPVLCDPMQTDYGSAIQSENFESHINAINLSLHMLIAILDSRKPSHKLDESLAVELFVALVQRSSLFSHFLNGDYGQNMGNLIEITCKAFYSLLSCIESLGDLQYMACSESTKRDYLNSIIAKTLCSDNAFSSTIIDPENSGNAKTIFSEKIHWLVILHIAKTFLGSEQDALNFVFKLNLDIPLGIIHFLSEENLAFLEKKSMPAQVLFYDLNHILSKSYKRSYCNDFSMHSLIRISESFQAAEKPSLLFLRDCIKTATLGKGWSELMSQKINSIIFSYVETAKAKILPLELIVLKNSQKYLDSIVYALSNCLLHISPGAFQILTSFFLPRLCSAKILEESILNLNGDPLKHLGWHICNHIEKMKFILTSTILTESILLLATNITEQNQAMLLHVFKNYAAYISNTFIDQHGHSWESQESTHQCINEISGYKSLNLIACDAVSTGQLATVNQDPISRNMKFEDTMHHIEGNRFMEASCKYLCCFYKLLLVFRTCVNVNTHSIILDHLQLLLYNVYSQCNNAAREYADFQQLTEHDIVVHSSTKNSIMRILDRVHAESILCEGSVFIENEKKCTKKEEVQLGRWTHLMDSPYDFLIDFFESMFYFFD